MLRLRLINQMRDGFGFADDGGGMGYQFVVVVDLFIITTINNILALLVGVSFDKFKSLGFLRHLRDFFNRSEIVGRFLEGFAVFVADDVSF